MRHVYVLVLLVLMLCMPTLTLAQSATPAASPVPAGSIADLLANCAAEGASGAFIDTVMKQSPQVLEASCYDDDMVGFGIVKIHEDSVKPSSLETGYWEPKLVFHAVAMISGAGRC